MSAPQELKIENGKLRIKIFGVICFLLLSFSTLNSQLSTVYAQAPASPSTTKAQLDSYTPLSPQYINIVLINLVHTISCFGEGRSIINQPCIGLGPSESKTNPTSLVPYEVNGQTGGALGAVGNLMALSYLNPPLRTAEYLGDLRKNLFIVKPAYAQVEGSGSSVLSVIKNIWLLTRNIAYLGITGIFLVIGFMIMLRHKLNPQTVVSIQSAIPGLVISLILITFSYLIASFIVDLSFVSTQLTGNILISQGLVNKEKGEKVLSNGNVLNVFQYFLAINPQDLIGNSISVFTFLHEAPIGKFISVVEGYFACQIAKEFTPDITIFGTTIPGKWAGCLAGFAGVGLIPTFFPALAGAISGTLVGIVLFAVLFLAIIIAMFKLLIALVNCYISIIILTITAPLRFALGAIPGSKGGFGPWFKEMIGNSMVFPVVFMALFLAAYLQGPGWGVQGNPFGINGYTSYPRATVPLLGGFGGTVIPMMLSFGLLLLLPNVPELVKNAFGVKDPGYGKMAFGAAAGAFGLGRGVGGKLFEPLRKERASIEKGFEEARFNPDYSKRAAAFDAASSRISLATAGDPWWRRAYLRARRAALTAGVNTQGGLGDRNQALRRLQTDYRDALAQWEASKNLYATDNAEKAPSTPDEQNKARDFELTHEKPKMPPARL